ncbi:dihydrolipoamide acetyltransferase family protein [Lipingzhangella sp. LS1_29]|uniref:Dihydrolipoamide acetyltransferase component of pyruvate dehydrogenase complex n=1 Tax=Lipingzhangella rawalii TaxID=2055835 RepID=A0ABU2H464_9ACTN|nr:dihydrolipoamide acetyltransferase family protein [Lipingzhangella rawalii]MDS1270081.1 dihydrolipoamide acetyltransferase family protein [Lipingzhangella rawalii]
MSEQSQLEQFHLPDVGEGLTEAEILTWHVQPGDEVTVNQIIVEVETAKAAVELPTPFAGTVHELLAAEGATVDVGSPIITVNTGGGAATGGGGVPEQDATEEQPEKPLVGTGAKEGATRRRARRRPAATNGDAPPAPARDRSGAEGVPAAVDGAAAATGGAGTGARGADDTPASGRVVTLAKPPVRKLAKDLGVDLAAVTPTGDGGVVTRADVHRHHEATSTSTSASASTATTGAEAQQAPQAVATDGGREGREERIPVRGVRKHTAAAMVRSAFTAPHVTEFLQVDVTETVAAVERLRQRPEFSERKVSPLLLIAKALLATVRRHPGLNASWDDEAQEIVIRHYVNLGIAAATERGLVVPNIKEAQDKSLPELADEMQRLTETARRGATSLAELSGGTITITNVGVFGVDAGTPILNPGEAAILAFGQIRDMPWVHQGELAVRKVTTLSLSFDHRMVDGELGSKALRDIGAMLEDPLTALAWS